MADSQVAIYSVCVANETTDVLGVFNTLMVVKLLCIFKIFHVNDTMLSTIYDSTVYNHATAIHILYYPNRSTKTNGQLLIGASLSEPHTSESAV